MNEELERSVELTMAHYDLAIENEPDVVLRALMARDRAKVERLVRERVAEYLAAEQRRRLH